MVSYISPPNAPEFHRKLVLDLNRDFATFPAGYQTSNANLTAISGLTTAADQITYWTGAGIAAQTTLTPFARTLLDDTTASAARTTLGLGAAALLAVPIPVASGGTGATTATAARTNLQAAYYEEGAWTPTLFGSTTAGTTTYNGTTAGIYSVNGNVVTAIARVSWSAVTGTGGVLIGNLPFAVGGAAGLPYRAAVSIGYYNNLSLTAGTVLNSGYGQEGQNTIRLTKMSNTTSNTSVNMTEMPSGDLYFTLVYRRA